MEDLLSSLEQQTQALQQIDGTIWNYAMQMKSLEKPIGADYNDQLKYYVKALDVQIQASKAQETIVQQIVDAISSELNK